MRIAAFARISQGFMTSPGILWHHHFKIQTLALDWKQRNMFIDGGSGVITGDWKGKTPKGPGEIIPRENKIRTLTKGSRSGEEQRGLSVRQHWVQNHPIWTIPIKYQCFMRLVFLCFFSSPILSKTCIKVSTLLPAQILEEAIKERYLQWKIN